MKLIRLLTQGTLCLVISLLTVPYTVSATVDAPDAYAYFNWSRGFDCKLSKFITSQPEWEPLIDTITQKIDLAYGEASISVDDFPKEFADMALDKIRLATNKSEVSSKDVLKILRREFKAVLLSVWVNPQVEKPEGAISLFTRFNPAELEDFLKLVHQASYRQVKRDSSGTLYEFSGDDDDTFYAGFTQLADHSDYVLAFSGQQNRVEQQLEFGRSGEFLKTVLASSGPFDRIEFTPAFFEKSREKILQEIESRSDSETNGQNINKIVENLENFSLYTEDTLESTVTTLSVTLKNEEDAKNLREAINGFIAMLKFLAAFDSGTDESVKKAIGLLSQIKFAPDARTVSASLKYNTPEIENAIKEFLAKTVVELGAEKSDDQFRFHFNFKSEEQQ